MSVRESHIEWPDLERFPDIPIFNTKAVVQQTNVPAPTLRAWERRYTILSPERAGNDYRLYSERDVATIRWLKERVDAGMSISQAIALLRHLEGERRQLQEQEQAITGGVPFFHVTLPPPPPPPPLSPTSLPPSLSAPPEQAALSKLEVEEQVAPEKLGNEPGCEEALEQCPAAGEIEHAFTRYPATLNMHIVRQHLLDAFKALDETTAKALLASMLAVYPVEQVCAELIAPTLWEIGRLWETGELSVAVEHFASGIFRGVLTNLLYVTPTPTEGPLVFACCAPGEAHELAVLMLALILRRSGMRVAYLGQSIEIEGLLHIIRQMAPALVCVSLTMPAYMASLVDLAHRIQELPEPRPRFVFGGQVFGQYAHLIPQVPGTYLDGDMNTITAGIRRLLSSRSESK
jgi:MerR family transcriptional regulator, light-induced transcriptional regulator